MKNRQRLSLQIEYTFLTSFPQTSVGRVLLFSHYIKCSSALLQHIPPDILPRESDTVELVSAACQESGGRGKRT